MLVNMSASWFWWGVSISSRSLSERSWIGPWVDFGDAHLWAPNILINVNLGGSEEFWWGMLWYVGATDVWDEIFFQTESLSRTHVSWIFMSSISTLFMGSAEPWAVVGVRNHSISFNISFWGFTGGCRNQKDVYSFFLQHEGISETLLPAS